MATASKSPDPASEAEAKPETSKVRASEVKDDVFKAIEAAGPEGISLKALEETTGLRYRVLHNVVWHLGLNPAIDEPQIRKVGEGRKLMVASVEAKAEAKPPTRKTRARKATTAKAA